LKKGIIPLDILKQGDLSWLIEMDSERYKEYNLRKWFYWLFIIWKGFTK